MIDQLYQRQGLVVVSFSSVSLPGMLNYSIAAAKLRHQLLSSEKKIIFPLPTLESIIFVVEIMSFLKSLGDTRRAGVSITTNNDTKTTVSPRGEINDLGYKKKKCPDSSGAAFYLFPKSAMIRPNFLKYVGLWTISTSWGWGGCGKSPLSNIFQLIWNGKT